MSLRMNAWQRAVCRTYGHGDFSHLADSLNWRAELSSCGDTLFTFLMIELADKEGCDDSEEAVRRLEVARRDIDGALAAIGRLGVN